MKYRADNSQESCSFAHHSELYASGEDAFRNGDVSEARKFFQIALEYCPDNGDTWRALANCYAAMRKPKKAEECFRKALQFADEDSIADIHFDFGNCLFDQAKYTEALQHYLLIPESASVWRQASRNILLARQMLSPEKAPN